MNIINILIVVDTLGSTSSNNLMNNIYLVDNNKYLGSWNQGTCNLITICQDGQQVNWRVVPVSPNADVNISGFSGDMVSKKICCPERQGIGGEYYWSSRVENKESIGQFSYTISLSIDGKTMSFNPILKII